VGFRDFGRHFRRGEVLRGGPLRAALRALLAEDYESAEEALTGLVREDSQDVDGYLGLASLYRRRGEVGRAIQVHQNLLLRADLSDDARLEALIGLAKDFGRGGFVRRAIAAYEEVLVHDSRHRVALRGLLAGLVSEGEYERALSVQNRLARFETSADPDAEVVLLTRMAAAAQADGEADRSRKLLKRALRKNPSFVEARILLGELEAQRGKNKAALAAWRQGAEIGGPSAAAIYPKLTPAFAAVGRSADCELFLRELAHKRPGDAELGIALARVLAHHGDVPGAIGELRRLLHSNPRQLSIRIELGQLLLSDGPYSAGSSQSRQLEASKEYGELLSMLAGATAASPGKLREAFDDSTPHERPE